MVHTHPNQYSAQDLVGSSTVAEIRVLGLKDLDDLMPQEHPILRARAGTVVRGRAQKAIGGSVQVNLAVDSHGILVWRDSLSAFLWG